MGEAFTILKCSFIPLTNQAFVVSNEQVRPRHCQNDQAGPVSGHLQQFTGKQGPDARMLESVWVKVDRSVLSAPPLNSSAGHRNAMGDRTARFPRVSSLNTTDLITDAKFLLIVEKDATFQRLLDDNFCYKMSPCIMVTVQCLPLLPLGTGAHPMGSGREQWGPSAPCTAPSSTAEQGTPRCPD